MVDVFVNPEFYNAFQGHELTIIFENAFKKYEVNETRLFYYASRRSKKEELEKFLLTNSLLPSQI
ncbi:MAG: hypothetical protein IPH89_16075 [Bacteroidetes bacterium]|nr:hypothetical protein [Bacteroidota bacterium]